MHVEDLLQHERIREVCIMLREMSMARSPLDVMSAWRRHWTLRPMACLLSLSTRDLPPGQYRVTRVIDVEAVLAGRLEPTRLETWRRRDLIPVHTGGVIGDWIARGSPQLIRDLRVDDDPVLGNTLAPYRSALVLPLYHEGEPVFWNVQLRREPDAFDLPDIEHTLMMVNQAGANNTRLLLVEEVRDLNARLTAQLEEVARVQVSLLPRGSPNIPGLEIATSYLASDRAGGDYYDFLPFDDGTWGIMIADVSGHGPAAATIMAMVRGVLHASAGPGRSPQAVLRGLNTHLVGLAMEGMFVTAFYAVYDPRTAGLTYARAGHNPPILKDGRTGAVKVLTGAGGLPLGIMGETFDVEQESITLSPMDTLVLYTDGITEAHSPDRQMFGPERLDQALVQCTGMPDCVVDSVHGALFAHTGSLTRADDQTLIAIRYVAPVAAPAPVTVSLVGA